MNPVFIIGTGRCGSTFVHEVIAKHEGMGFISNIEDNLPKINTLGRWNNRLYSSFLGDHTRKGGLRFAPSEGYNLFSKEVSPIYANSCRDLMAKDVTPWLESRTVDFFEKRHKAQNRDIFSHKYTGWSRIQFFLKIFPDAKFIHIVRDGRAVANSWLQMPWWGGYRGPKNWLWGELPNEYQQEWLSKGQSFPHLAAISWKVLMDSFHESENFLTEAQYLKIKYEDILEDPKEKFAEILEFSGLDWSSKFEKSFANQKIIKGRSRAFEKDLDKSQVIEIEESLADYLSMYGYE